MRRRRGLPPERKTGSSLQIVMCNFWRESFRVLRDFFCRNRTERCCLEKVPPGFGVAIDSVTLRLPDRGRGRTLTVTGIGGVDESYYEIICWWIFICTPREIFESLTGQGSSAANFMYDLQCSALPRQQKLCNSQRQYAWILHENLNVMGSAGQATAHVPDGWPTWRACCCSGAGRCALMISGT